VDQTVDGDVAVGGALTRPDGLGDVVRRVADVPESACSPPAGGGALVSFAEHLHLAVGVVDINGELIELLDEVLDVLRFELGEVDRYT
jgi:hypothetical protein